MKPKIICQDTHKINKDIINSNVISILKKLKSAGFHAYIIGGGVRDILLGFKPKDFDIATDARPEQVRSILRNSRIIGRRFKLIHAYFGREIIEIATFRATPSQEVEEVNDLNSDHATLDGRIIRDNIYGCIEDDIWRRDFTVNAIYYDAIDQEIIDYCDGYQDLLDHKLKILGDAKVRYQEDAVRMLRALRFAAKLDFTIDKDTLAPINDPEFHALLDAIPKSRLFEEYNKLFLHGHAEKSFTLLKKHKLLHKLFPLTATDSIEQAYPQHLSFVHAVLNSTDSRYHNELPINPAFLLAAYLWHPLQVEHNNLVGRSKSKSNKEYIWRQAVHNTIKKQNLTLAIPKRFSKVIEDIWYLQRLFNRPNKKSVMKAAVHPKFRAGFDFLNIRSDTEATNETLLKWWQDYEAADDKTRKIILDNYESP